MTKIRTPVRKPGDLDELTDDEEREVSDLLTDMEEHFASGKDLYYVNTTTKRVRGSTTSDTVWREVVRRAQDAGWDATFKGAIVEIKRP